VREGVPTIRASSPRNQCTIFLNETALFESKPRNPEHNHRTESPSKSSMRASNSSLLAGSAPSFLSSGGWILERERASGDMHVGQC